MSDLKVRPLHDRVIVQRGEVEETTAGGIVLPGTASEKPAEGIVLAIGAGKVLNDGTVVPMAVSVGDKVLFGKYAGQEVTIDGEDYLVMPEEEIIAVVE